MPRYIILQAQLHEQFRKNELQAVSDRHGLTVDFSDYNPDLPFWPAYIANDNEAAILANDSVTTRSIFRHYAEGVSLEHIRSRLKLNLDEIKAKFGTSSFKFDIEVFNSTLSKEEQTQIIESFGFLPLNGPVLMKNPDVTFGLLLYSENRAIKYCYFGRLIARGLRDLIRKFDLKKRPYIGITSFDAELSLITAKMALAAPGKIIYDPFVGTGSFLYACAQFGASVMGSDLDGRTLRGSNNLSIQTNISNYNQASRFIDVWTSDIFKIPIRSTFKVDAIVTDPPYGVRAGAKTSDSSCNVKFPSKQPQNLINELMKFKYHSSLKVLEIEDIVYQLFDLASRLVRPGGRLCFWVPVPKALFSSEIIPSHESFSLIAHSIQEFNKWQRVLLTYERNHIPYAASVDRKTNGSDCYRKFRERYMQGFKSISCDTSPKQNVGHIASEICELYDDEYQSSERFSNVCRNRYRFIHSDTTLGFIEDGVVEALEDTSKKFIINTDTRTVSFAEEVNSFAERCAVMKDVLEKWKKERKFEILEQWRDELNSVFLSDREEFVRLERCALPLFGFLMYASHLIAYTHSKKDSKLRLWVQRRSYRTATCPGMLDNTVGGGITSGGSPIETIIRESMEEASLDSRLIGKSVISTGTVTSITKAWLKNNSNNRVYIKPLVIHCYELELTSEIKPRPNDEEAAEFFLGEIPELLQAIRKREIKPESKVVYLDFLVRHGYITVENEPGFFDIERALHFAMPFPKGYFKREPKINASEKIIGDLSDSLSDQTPDEYSFEIFQDVKLQLETRFCFLLLNQPFSMPRDLFESLWVNSLMNICCDGAGDRLCTQYPELIPDCISGDLDSISKMALEKFKKQGATILQDNCLYTTDFFKGLQAQRIRFKNSRERTSIIVHKPLGGRFDQVMGNICQAVKWVSQNTFQKIYLVDDESVVIVCRGCTTTKIRFNNKSHRGVLFGPHCGVMPFNGPAKVTTRGLRWNLDHVELKYSGIISSNNLIDGADNGPIEVDIQVHSNEAVLWTMEMSKIL